MVRVDQEPQLVGASCQRQRHSTLGDWPHRAGEGAWRRRIVGWSLRTTGRSSSAVSVGSLRATCSRLGYRPRYLSPAVGRETRLERARDRSPAIEARCGRRIVSSVDACCRHARTVVDVSERGDAPVQAHNEVLGAQRPSLAATVTSLRCGGGRLQQPMGGVHRRWNEQENRRSRGLSALGWFGGPACYAGHGTTGSDRYTSRPGGRESVRVSIRVRPSAPRSGARRTAGRSPATYAAGETSAF